MVVHILCGVFWVSNCVDCVDVSERLAASRAFGFTRTNIFEVWLWSYRNDFIAAISVHLQLIQRGHLPSTPLEQLCA